MNEAMNQTGRTTKHLPVRIQHKLFSNSAKTTIGTVTATASGSHITLGKLKLTLEPEQKAYIEIFTTDEGRAALGQIVKSAIRSFLPAPQYCFIWDEESGMECYISEK